MTGSGAEHHARTQVTISRGRAAMDALIRNDITGFYRVAEQVLDEADDDGGARNMFDFVLAVVSYTLNLVGMLPKAGKTPPVTQLLFEDDDGNVVEPENIPDHQQGMVLASRFAAAIANNDVRTAQALFLAIDGPDLGRDFLANIVRAAQHAIRDYHDANCPHDHT